MKNAVILCAGEGTKLWPYSVIRNKVMVKISNKPIVAYAVDSLTALGFENIVIIAGKFSEELCACFRDYTNVKIIVDESPHGTAFSLLCARDYVGDEDFLALYGDTILSEADISALAGSLSADTDISALVAPLHDRSSDCIGCALNGDSISYILGHSREDSTHYFGGFAFRHNIFDALKYNSGRFTDIEVGMMPPDEGYIEMTLSDEMKRGTRVKAVTAADAILDIDKPWHILEANCVMNKKACSALTENELAEGAFIDDTVILNGFVRLGKNSSIERNAIIEGNIIVGDDTHIFNGAIIQGNTVIGNNTAVRNACFVSEGSTIGSNCIVSHAAELDGMIMDGVYLYHYMEICGIVGENTDIGAATVCGSLRFDDGNTIQRVKGRREFPKNYADSVFLGDYCRTGVNATIMPGTKVGSRSIVGSGVLLQKDVPDNTIIYTQQAQVEKPWNSDKYGW